MTSASRDFTILAVDDEQDVLYSYAAMFRSAGFTSVITEQDSRRVMELMSGRHVDLVLLDLQMPHIGGLELLRQISARHPDVPVIIVTAANEIDMAVACMKAGAVDYFVKPVEKNRLTASIRRAAEAATLRFEIDAMRDQFLCAHLDGHFDGILTSSAKMRGIHLYLMAVAASSQPVLICGETGTGKEMAARAVHTASGRQGPFTAVNLAGLDDQMFSDTLFGHIRGAFTGASEKRDGLVARTSGGTLFLDEIGDLPEQSQVKLLRLLQEREYFPLGSDTPRRCDIRVVAATHRDLPELISAGRFRSDLYFRLRTHQVNLPPLRERREDIPLLLNAFIAEAAQNMRKPSPSYPPEVLVYLETRNFPGNIRELRSLAYDAVARHRRGMLSVEALLGHEPGNPVMPAAGNENIGLRLPDGAVPTLKEAEEVLIAQALRLSGGNQGAAARYLGISRQALNKKLVRNKRG